MTLEGKSILTNEELKTVQPIITLPLVDEMIPKDIIFTTHSPSKTESEFAPLFKEIIGGNYMEVIPYLLIFEGPNQEVRAHICLTRINKQFFQLGLPFKSAMTNNKNDTRLYILPKDYNINT